MSKNTQDIIRLLERIAGALDRLAPPILGAVDIGLGSVFVWEAHRANLKLIESCQRVDLDLLCGIDFQKDLLLENTRNFALGYGANNALLWGARGGGKSSLVKAVHAEVSKGRTIKLIEIHRDDIESLPILLDFLRVQDFPCIVFCDDLSFESEDISYKSLKAVLEGGVEGRPMNVIFYATSNRRHMMSRQMIENERSTAINPYESVEEKVSLSDRFGLWIGFHHCSQELYLEMIGKYVDYYGLDISYDIWRPEAIEWSITRGARSGRVAWQFVQGLSGRYGKSLRG